MKLTIALDDDKTIVYQDVTDLYIAIRQLKPVQKQKDGSPAVIAETTSYSWGSNIRELIKEVTQSLHELQDFLKERRHGKGSS